MTSCFEAEIAVAPGTFRHDVPIHVFLAEAVDVASASRRFWLPSGAGDSLVPGLSQAGLRVREAIAEEILELVPAAQAAQIDYLLAINPGASRGLLARAERVGDDLESALEWAFDDGVEDEKDAQLAAAKANDGHSIDRIALDLEELAELAERHVDLLREIPLFDLGAVAEARDIARQLRSLPRPNALAEEVAAKLARRNQVFCVLDARVKGLRAAARYVFRKHPAVVREFTSAYARRRRLAVRLKKQKAAV